MTAPLDNALAQATAWALVSSLWQGLAVGAIAWCLLRLLARSSARSRYRVAVCCMAAMVAVPAATGIRSYRSYVSAAADGQTVRNGFSTASSTAAGQTSATTVSPQISPPSASIPRIQRLFLAGAGEVPAWVRDLLLLLWLVGVAVHMLRRSVGLRATYRLTGTEVVAAPPWLEQMAAEISSSIGVRLCVVRLSFRATVPLVVGIVRPVILVPASFVTGLQPDALRALLAHELAHVRRHDFLLNLLQVVAESLLFYHPAAWWLTRRVRAEREHCCDEIAAACVQDRRAVAQALVAAEELRAAPQPAFALAATDGLLSQRVRRLLQPPHAGRDRDAAAMGLAVLASALLAIPATALHQSAPVRAGDWQQIWNGDITEGGWLRVYNLNGPLVVERGPVERGTVLARTRGADVVITATEPRTHEVVVCVMRPELGECNAEGLIWRGSEAELGLSVTQLRVIVPHSYNVEAAAHSGDLTVTGGTASLIARTSDGRVELTGVRGDASVRTTNGDVVARLASGRADRALDIGTGTGSVLVTLPPDALATLTAWTGEGRVRLDYPAISESRRSAEQRALVGGGGPPMRIVAGRGDITVTPR